MESALNVSFENNEKNNLACDDHSLPQPQNKKQDSATLTNLSYDCSVKSKKNEDNNPKSGTQTSKDVVLQTRSLSETVPQKDSVSFAVEPAEIIRLISNCDQAVKRFSKLNESEIIKGKDIITKIESKIVTSENDITLQKSEQKLLAQNNDVKVEDKLESDHQVNTNLQNHTQFSKEKLLEPEIKIQQSEFNKQNNNTDLHFSKKDIIPAKIKDSLQVVIHPTNEDKIRVLPQPSREVQKIKPVASGGAQLHKKQPIVSLIAQQHKKLQQCVSVHHKEIEVRPLCPPDIKHIPLIDLSSYRPRRRSLETIRAMDNGPPFIESGWMGNTTPCNYSTAHQEFFRSEVNQTRELVKPPAVLRTGYGYTNNKPNFVSTTKATYLDPETQYAEQHEKNLRHDSSGKYSH